MSVAFTLGELDYSVPHLVDSVKNFWKNVGTYEHLKPGTDVFPSEEHIDTVELLERRVKAGNLTVESAEYLARNIREIIGSIITQAFYRVIYYARNERTDAESHNMLQALCWADIVASHLECLTGDLKKETEAVA